MEINNEEEIRELVKSAYRPVAPPPELKDQLLEQLTLEASGAGISRPLWERPRVMVPILAAVIAGLVGYGAWLSMHVMPQIIP